MPWRPRATHELTLGFLTLGAQAAPLDVIDAAAAAGFGAAGLRISGRNPGDPWPSVSGDPSAFERIRDHAGVAGVRISNVSGYFISQQTQLEHLLENVEAARRCGAALILQGCFDPDLARVSALMRDCARAAADAGVRIALEFMPMSTMKTIVQAQQVIAESGAANVGLLIDALHLARSGATSRDVRALDPAVVYLTQLCDAAAERAPELSLFDEAMSGRMHLGDGGLDLAGLVDALPARAEIELETPVVAEAGLPGAQRACRAAHKAQLFFSCHQPASEIR